MKLTPVEQEVRAALEEVGNVAERYVFLYKFLKERGQLEQLLECLRSEGYEAKE